ncbi:MAG: oxidoreductase [Hyphomicrobiales bacterium]|nr:MAG: oxidoreductase [Hyphomicrobiales bacterium]
MPQSEPLSVDSAVVIVGAGQGGIQTAISLRSNGFDGAITVIGDEKHEPYQRPPLSKAFIASMGGHEEVRLRPSDFYAAQRISLVLDDPVHEVDRDRQQVVLTSGQTLAYDRLVIATGVRARPVPAPGGELSGVLTIRGLDDATALRTIVAATHDTGARPTHIVVIGGGFIGMEFAAMASGFGYPVTVVEAMHRTHARATSPEVSGHLERAHAEHGNQILLGQGVRRLLGNADGHVTALELSDGTTLLADLVLVGIGVLVNSEFLTGSGLDIAHGVAVDQHLRTADPNISAVGDCAYYPSVHGQRLMRVESVQNAVDQGRYVAERLVAPDQGPYASVPWFWTHQFKEKVQMVGIPGPNDIRFVTGDPTSGRFSVLHFADDQLTCVESVNSTADHMAARKALERGLPVTPDNARRTDFALATHVKALIADLARS